MVADFVSMEQFASFDTLLAEDELILRDSVRQFVNREVLPDIERHHRTGEFPRRWVATMARLGLFGASIREYGLPGLGSVAYGLMMQELERGDSGLRSFASVQNALVMYPIQRYGSDAQRERWIPAMAAGEAIGCFGLTEPDYGSNPAAMRTRARKVDGGHVLDGSKAWITNGSLADVAVVWARDEQDAVRGFLVERGTEGFESQPYDGKFSLRVSDTSALFLSDCFVPDSALLPGTSSLRHPLSCLNEARFGIAWGAVGSATAVAEHALAYTRERIQFGGRPIGSHQLVQDKLVFMASEIAKAQLLAWHISKLRDAGQLHFRHVSLAKRNNVWMARECARTARELVGAAGIVDDHPIIRHMLNLEAVYTYEGTHDIHTLVMGEQLTGIAAFEPPCDCGPPL